MSRASGVTGVLCLLRREEVTFTKLFLKTCLSFCFSAEQLAAIPEFKNLGPLFKSSESMQLTEAETEYFVRCIKHTFTDHIVFQVS